jgi:hypothetical protein
MPEEADPSVKDVWLKNGVKWIVPEEAPEVQSPGVGTTSTTSARESLTSTWYPAPLVVSMPTGHGVSVTVVFDPPISDLEMTSVQSRAVVAYVIPTGFPAPHELCLEFPVGQENAFVTSEPDWLEATTFITSPTSSRLGPETRPLISDESKSTAKARCRIATAPFYETETSPQQVRTLTL